MFVCLGFKSKDECSNNSLLTRTDLFNPRYPWCCNKMYQRRPCDDWQYGGEHHSVNSWRHWLYLDCNCSCPLGAYAYGTSIRIGNTCYCRAIDGRIMTLWGTNSCNVLKTMTALPCALVLILVVATIVALSASILGCTIVCWSNNHQQAPRLLYYQYYHKLLAGYIINETACCEDQFILSNLISSGICYCQYYHSGVCDFLYLLFFQ